MDTAAEMLELTKRFKTSAVRMDPAGLRPSHIGDLTLALDTFAANMRALRVRLGEEVAEDTAALGVLRGREASLVSEIETLTARKRGHAGEYKRTGDVMALSGKEQASFIKSALVAAQRGKVNSERTLSRSVVGELSSSRGYTMSMSHRLDPSCTGTLPGSPKMTNTHTLFPTLTRTAMSGGGGGGAPTFSPMRPKGGTYMKEGGLCVTSAKGGGALGIDSAISQLSKITLQEEAVRLGYRYPTDRLYAAAGAKAREMDIDRDATNI